MMQMVSATADREVWQAERRYEVVRVFDWFWRVEHAGALVGTVCEVKGEWRGWVGFHRSMSRARGDLARQEVIRAVVGLAT